MNYVTKISILKLISQQTKEEYTASIKRKTAISGISFLSKNFKTYIQNVNILAFMYNVTSTVKVQIYVFENTHN